MARRIYLKKNNIPKTTYVGFSWTTLFFGFFVPLFRGDWVWLLIMLILDLCSFGIASIILAFIYNRIYTRKLLEAGWEAADDFSYNILVSKGMIMPK